MGHANQTDQILRAGLVLARQPSGLHIMGGAHSKRVRLAVHLFNKGGQATGMRPAKRMSCPVFAGHQGQVHQLTAAEDGSDLEPRATALFGVNIVLGDGDHLTHG